MRLLVTDFAPLPKGRAPTRPLFAIGDIHGHSDAFEALLRHLRSQIVTIYRGDPVDLVYLGDLIDRGPDPLGAIALAREGLRLSSVREVALLGNHDHFLRAAAGIGPERLGSQEWMTWIANGGRETLEALGGLGYLDASPAALRAALGPDNVAFLAEMAVCFESGRVFCVHAGVDPDRPRDGQRFDDLLWIRRPFLDPAEDPGHPWPFGRTVVHGHTPDAFGVHPHRIGVDSGGYATGVFTAVEINSVGLRYHQLIRDDP